MIKAIEMLTTGKIGSKVNSSGTAMKVVKGAVKDGEELMAMGQDARAAQGKVMVNPYTKPVLEPHAKMERSQMKAASDTGGGGSGKYDGGEGPMPPEEVKGWNSSDIWGNGW